MISESQIREFAVAWQTTELNIAREYVQHILLSSLYSLPDVKLAFKGGTALKMLKGSPRFSEDLDFTGWGKSFHIKGTLEQTVRESQKAGLIIKTNESNPTAGGWFARTATRIHDWPVSVEWNISLRHRGMPKTETIMIVSEICPSYTIRSLMEEELVREKIQAALTRKKARDFFDIYFIIRGRLSIREIIPHKEALIKEAGHLNNAQISRELKQILPRSYSQVSKHLPEVLLRELKRL